MTDTSVPGMPGDLVGLLVGRTVRDQCLAEDQGRGRVQPFPVALLSDALAVAARSPDGGDEVLGVVRLNGTPPEPKDELDLLADAIAEVQVQMKGEYTELVSELWDVLNARREQRDFDSEVGSRITREVHWITTEDDAVMLGRAARMAVDAVRSSRAEGDQ